MERKKKTILLALVLGWLTWISGIFGNSGLLQAYELAQVKHEMVLRVKALDNEKAHLQANLTALEHDPFVQEQAIRESLGFVRTSELVFEFH